MNVRLDYIELRNNIIYIIFNRNNNVYNMPLAREKKIRK